MNKPLILFLPINILLSCAGVGYDSAKLENLHRTLANETQKASIYDGFQSRAFFKVIYRSTELRKQYADSVAEMESMTDTEKEALLLKELDEDKKFFDFYVVLSTTEFKANDLNMKNSLWRIFLEDKSGARIYPAEVREIKPNQKIKLLYPGVSRFGKFYHIRFEKKDQTDIRGFKLVFSSVLGKAVFRY
ncbi:MAG: hypothetical protein N3B13_08135 [Deltaproteobacteria bacterium]|nr:hypothetical protein [Deltaproteobacteria bacterium]